MHEKGQSTDETSPERAAIQAIIEERIRAIRKKDVAAVLAGYAGDVVTFDLVPPTANRGVAGVRQRLAAWFDSFETSIDYGVEELELAVAGDVAFDHHLTHVAGTTTTGAKIDMWFRETIGYRKMAGHWKVTHQHSSVPVEMKTGKPLLERTS